MVLGGKFVGGGIHLMEGEGKYLVCGRAEGKNWLGD